MYYILLCTLQIFIKYIKMMIQIYSNLYTYNILIYSGEKQNILFNVLKMHLKYKYVYSIFVFVLQHGSDEEGRSQDVDAVAADIWGLTVGDRASGSERRRRRTDSAEHRVWFQRPGHSLVVLTYNILHKCLAAIKKNKKIKTLFSYRFLHE